MSLINNLDATKSVVLQRQQIVNDENGNRLDKAISLDDIRVDLTPDLLFNLIALFRVFLTMQAQTQIIEGN